MESESTQAVYHSIPCHSSLIAERLVSEIKKRWCAENIGGGDPDGCYEVDEDSNRCFRVHSNCDYHEFEVRVEEKDTIMGTYDCAQVAANLDVY